VSHQTYAYKILTGRRDRFPTLRQYGGISGFLRRDESPCDAFGAGHSGTAVSAALGMAVARDRLGGDEQVVAVVGDGSMGCGIVFEALNNATLARRLIVVLNDNEMSISANVGALSKYLGKLLVNPQYNRWKRSIESVMGRSLGGWAWLKKVYWKTEETLKGMFLRSVLFEELGLRYIGPVDGHDIETLISALTIARDANQPILLHVSTQKGRGYPYAEEEPERWHGTSAFDISSGKTSVSPSGGPVYSQVFGTVLERLATADRRVVAITAAMPAGTGLSGFAARFPTRFFDVGIAEEHAVIFAAGLATRGMIPVFAVYSTFAQRAIDCMIHDVALQNLPVILCLDRAGIVGDDGPTHHGIFDLPLLRSVPNLILMQPKDEAELAAMLTSAVRWERPVVIRYPRGRGPGTPIPENPPLLEVGKAEVIRPGTTVQIWALGDQIPAALQAATLLTARGLSVGVVNPRFVRPLDHELMYAQAREARIWATLENGVAAGGFGSAMAEHLAKSGFQGPVLRFGWPDEFIPHGDPAILFDRYGLTPQAIAESILAEARRVIPEFAG
jgi:1-deoxy-D-xylulose-5-phosphate synthase